MEKLLLKLAAQLLDEYGTILIRNSFNAPSKEVEAIVNLFNKEDFNKILAEYSGGCVFQNGEDCEGGRGVDWIITKAVSRKISDMAAK